MKATELLARSFLEAHPESAAAVLETMSVVDAAKAMDGQPPPVVVAVLERLTPTTAGAVVSMMEEGRAAAAVAELSPRAAAAALLHLEAEVSERLLSGLPERKSRLLRELLRYPAHTAGGMMDPRVTSIAIDLTVQQAVAVLRRAPRHTLHYLYVTGRDGKLIGVLNMRELLLALPRDPVEALVHRDFVSVPAMMDREEVVSLMRERKFFALPVVDAEGCLLGVVQAERAMEAAQHEAYEDMQRIVGAGGEERALWPVRKVVKSRLPWLYVNLATAFLAAGVVGMFESTIATMTALAVLMPVVAGQSGNCGAQALAVVMRSLALREIGPGTGKRVVFKEALAGAFNGAAVGIVTGLIVWAWDGRWALGAVIAAAMLASMLLAALSGAAIPMGLKALGRDPAQSSSILLTTVTDIVGFGSFLGLAMAASSLLVDAPPVS